MIFVLCISVSKRNLASLLFISCNRTAVIFEHDFLVRQTLAARTSVTATSTLQLSSSPYSIFILYSTLTTDKHKKRKKKKKKKKRKK
ncbi:hypothetical protein BCR41DRAFT_4547 [Lobosporangium transversale]|uniref:Uncharacterized protein n=1 Tax=Lobosporangium transversale TaxID=64571 RepID=A0A1Y2H2J4_9FUNG|nr:hypothetical protein BCR41DRAFT_4547 [Lobosporangium transversale]ORZ28766.1 hypothetical protein BCR41DRAFT_4547 [Lobosporangium transversale]|eukprot:XP_021886439.1 hypothetical protein BCR41DRAFT_4547 [Lobosporangium transversale]